MLAGNKLKICVGAGFEISLILKVSLFTMTSCITSRSDYSDHKTPLKCTKNYMVLVLYASSPEM